MMTSSNGNIFRVTGYLCGEFTGHEYPAPMTQNFEVFFDLRLNQQLSANNGDADDLRRHRAHYNFIVMKYQGVPGPNLSR